MANAHVPRVLRRVRRRRYREAVLATREDRRDDLVLNSYSFSLGVVLLKFSRFALDVMCRSVFGLSLSLFLSSLTQQHNTRVCHSFLIRQSPGDWEEIYGEETPETPYYVHRKTRETTWTKPEYLAWTRVEYDWKEEEDGKEEKNEDKGGPEEGNAKKKGSWFSSSKS